MNHRLGVTSPQERGFDTHLPVREDEILQGNGTAVTKRDPRQPFVITDGALGGLRGDGDSVFGQCGLDLRQERKEPGCHANERVEPGFGTTFSLL